MKTLHHAIIAIVLLCGFRAGAQTTTYTNFIRQTQYPSLIQWDASVLQSGSQLSALSIEGGGANFQLWTVASNSTVTSYNINSGFVASFVPVASVTVSSADTTSLVPRTRCDQPFYVNYTISGLLASGTGIPAAATSVNLLHYVQSYGTGGTGIGIDRTQATLLTQASVTTNGTQTLTYAITVIPGSNRTKIRGEETFSIFSLEDPDCGAPSSQVASQYIQIWPVADGSITGITNGQVIRMLLPQVTLTINDIYPNSQIYAQVYKGNAVLGTKGTMVPGSSLVVQDSVPQNRVLLLNGYDSVFGADGLYTMELLSQTPFGIDRLAYVTFTLNRTLRLNSMVVDYTDDSAR